MARLKEKYNQEIKNNLQKKLGLSNVMEVPEIKKITVNMGVGEAVQDKKTIEKAVADLEKLSGQKVLITRARKSVASPSNKEIPFVPIKSWFTILHIVLDGIANSFSILIVTKSS